MRHRRRNRFRSGRTSQPRRACNERVTLIGTGNMGAASPLHIAKAGHTLTITGRDAAKEYRSRRRSARRSGIGAPPTAPTSWCSPPVTPTRCRAQDASGPRRPRGHRHHQPAPPRLHGPDVGPLDLGRRGNQEGAAGALVVKAFNTVFAQVLAAGPTLAGETVPVYFAGDDAAAESRREGADRKHQLRRRGCGWAQERPLSGTAGRTQHLSRLRRQPERCDRTRWIGLRSERLCGARAAPRIPTDKGHPT